ncbi:MAG: type 4a pilus biogenesis protein PilO [Chlamydiota bacterium]
MRTNLLRMIIIGGSLVALVWAFFRFVFIPVNERVGTVAEEIIRLRSMAGAAYAVERERERFNRDEAAILAEEKILAERLPRASNIPSIVRDLSQCAAECGADIESIQPGESKEEVYRGAEGPLRYHEVDISIELDAAYVALVKYCARIQEQKELMSLKRIELQPHGGAQGVRARIEIATFYMVEPS